MASPREELEVLAVLAKQAVGVVDALRDRLDALVDPYCTFGKHATRLEACVHLLREAADEVASVAKGEAQRERFVARTVTP